MRSSNFNLRLKHLLSHYSITQKELSRKSGIMKQTMSLYVQGKREPNIKNLIKISDATNISPSWLLGYGTDDVIETIM